MWRVSPCRESRLGIQGVGWSSAPPHPHWPGTCTARGPSPRTTGASSPACRTGAGSRSSRSQGRWPVPPSCTDRIRVCKCDDGVFVLAFYSYSKRQTMPPRPQVVELSPWGSRGSPECSQGLPRYPQDILRDSPEYPKELPELYPRNLGEEEARRIFCLTEHRLCASAPKWVKTARRAISFRPDRLGSLREGSGGGALLTWSIPRTVFFFLIRPWPPS